MIEALAAPRHHRHGPRADRHVGLRRHLVPETHRDRRVGWADVWHPQRGGLEPVRQPGHRPALRRRPQHAWSCWRSRTRPRRAAARRWASTCRGWCPASSLRDDIKPLEITQPEGVSFTLDGNLLRWQRWSLRLGFNHARGARAPHASATRTAIAAPGGAPAVVRRDGRPVPRPDERPLRRGRRSTSASGASAS